MIIILFVLLNPHNILFSMLFYDFLKVETVETKILLFFLIALLCYDKNHTKRGIMLYIEIMGYDLFSYVTLKLQIICETQ